MSAEAAKPLYNNKNPFQATHPVNIKLTGAESEKDTRHHEISLAGSGLIYEAGDALALKATNDPELVELTIQALGCTGDESVKVKDVEKPLREALFRDYVLHFVEKKFIAKLAERGVAKMVELSKPENAAALTAYTNTRHETRDYVDILREFPEVKLTPQEFCDGCMMAMEEFHRTVDGNAAKKKFNADGAIDGYATAQATCDGEAFGAGIKKNLQYGCMRTFDKHRLEQALGGMGGLLMMGQKTFVLEKKREGGHEAASGTSGPEA